MADFHFPPPVGPCPQCGRPVGGHQLPNGVPLLAVSEVDRDGGAIVLAEFVGPQPFVTWQVDAAGAAFWGHYFALLPDAAADFAARIKRA